MVLRPRHVQGGAARAKPPWETGAVVGDGGQRQQRWVCSRPARWDPPRQPPVALRHVLVAAPEGTRRLDALLGPDLAATPGERLPWVVRRWSVAVSWEAGRAPPGLESPRPGSDQALARTPPVLLALCSRVTVLALTWSHGAEVPVPLTAWSHQTAPSFADWLAVVRRHRWRARSLMTSAATVDSWPFPQEAFERLIHGLPSAASWPKSSLKGFKKGALRNSYGRSPPCL